MSILPTPSTGNALWIYLLGLVVGVALGAIVYGCIRGEEKNAKDVLEDYPVSHKEMIEPASSLQVASK